jgi:sugar/nucleoside kinase (ribokinase family)
VSRGYSVAVIGDINLDVLIRVPEGRLADRTKDVFVEAPMDIRAAGTGGGFALAATSAFDRVHLFGRVGDDEIADAILKDLDHPAITLHVARDRERPSRVVVILREGPPASQGVRVMIPRTDVANSALADDDLAELCGDDAPADVVLVDGYSYLQDPARASVIRATTRVASGGRPIAFDVVPHNLYERWSVDELLTAVAPCSIVIAEAATLLRFLGMAKDSGSIENVRDALPQLRDRFGPRTLLLRFGVGQIDQSLIVWPDGSSRHRQTGYAMTEDAAGFGDRLTAAELVEVLDHLRGRR